MSTAAHPATSFEELTPAATPPVAATPEATPAAPATPAETIPQFTEADANAYRQMVDAGITPQNYNEFLQAKTALSNLSVILKSNPRALLNEIEKSDPQLARTIKEEFSNAWFEEYQRTHPDETPATPGSTSRTSPSVNPVLEQKLDQMSKQVEGLVNRINSEDTAKANQAITDGFNKSLDNLAAKLPDTLTEVQKDYIRLKAQESLFKDPAAAARVAKGMYVDLSKHFAEATKKATADTKAAAASETTRREGVVTRSDKQITPAAEPAGGTPATDSNEDPIWGNITSGEVQNALKR